MYSCVQIKWGSFCMNSTTLRDLWVGGVLVNTCIIELRRLTFLKEKKQIHHVIEFSYLFVVADSLSQLDNDSINIKIESD